ncbi:ATP-binding protein [Alkalihalophilus pseudofirmus]|uniref:histidine kinase n=1 Tax=Alkalihalophilus pseudofirmus TaxID=79885 RepID=A0AAJ2U4E3_ALKPS|nr:ATP-binding protein [Alkalihalophilus pseudofirmus]MDV2887041.1 ATP-binding protein [Alkalihalophilus pseudofirmus]
MGVETDIKSFIKKRNRLMIIVLWLSYALTMAVFIFDPVYSSKWPPVGFSLLVGLMIIRKLLKNEYWMMYIISFTMFFYLFVLNVEFPYLVNYIYILLGIIITSLYQHYGVTIFSGVLAIFSLTYFFYFSFEEIFTTVEPVDIAYIIALSIIIMMFFLFHIKFTKSLWVKARLGEKQAKEKLASTENYLDAFFTQTSEAIVVYDSNGKIINVNEAFSSLYGWVYEELINRHINEFIPPQWEATSELEMIHKSREGKPLSVAIAISYIKDTNGKIVAYLMMIWDISERKRTEAQLRQSEKLKVVGELAAGIAHEIRNPITVLSGFTQLMENSHHKEMMQAELKRMDGIVEELLILAKPRAAELAPISIKELIEEVILLFESICMNQKINVNWNNNHTPLIYGDYNRLKQVLINVFKNAIEAIEYKGCIEITLSTIKDQVCIHIENDGPPIPSEMLCEIGSPFYTTKETGTGLGLMISSSIMKEHEGSLSIKNREESGVVVTLTLPRHNGERM